MNACALRWAIGLAFVVMAPGGFADDRPSEADRRLNTVALLPYGAENYRFLVLGAGDTPPAGFEQPDFDDTGFQQDGRAPFGGGAGGISKGVDCPLRANVHTRWRTNTQLVARQLVEIPAGARNLRLVVSVDNDIVGVFLNGHSVSLPTPHDGCPVEDEFLIDLPREHVNFGAPNLLAFHVLDRGRESYFDATLLAELNDGPLFAAFDALQRAIDELTPQVVSVSALTIDDCPPPRPDGSTQVRVGFRVDGTGARGQVLVTASRGRIEVGHQLDGEEQYTTTLTPRRAQVVVPNPLPPQRTRTALINSAAFPAAVQRAPVVAAVTQCIAANDRIVNQSSCDESVDVAHANCNQMCDGEETRKTNQCVPTKRKNDYCVLDRELTRQAAIQCRIECERAASRLRRGCP